MNDAYRDGAGLRMQACQECGRNVPSYDAYERRGVIYCSECAWNTAEKRAYEKWFVDPKS